MTAKKIIDPINSISTSADHTGKSDMLSVSWRLDHAEKSMVWKTLLQEQEDAGYELLEDAMHSMPAVFRLPPHLLQPTQPALVFEDSTNQDIDVADNTAFAKGRSQQAYLWLRRMLAQGITRLIDRDMNQLMQILYRIDVAESRVQEAFQAPFRDIPCLLADLIIARQIEKVLFRRNMAKTSTDIAKKENEGF